MPLDLSAPAAARALTLACGDCKALRKEVEEVKEHLKTLIDQFTAFTGNVADWQRRAVDATSPSSSDDLPNHRGGRRLSSSPLSSGSRKRKSTMAAAMSTSQQQYHSLLQSPEFGWSTMYSPWWSQVPPIHGSLPPQGGPGSIQPHWDTNAHAPSSKWSTWSSSRPSSEGGSDASSVKSDLPIEAVDVAKRRRLSVPVGAPMQSSDTSPIV